MVKRDEEILFMGVEVAKLLGYSDPSCTVRKHVDDDEKSKYQKKHIVKTAMWSKLLYHS